MIRRFLSDKNANVAMLFGLMLIPMLIGAGVGIDMMRAGQVRSQLADASDAALLAAARAKLKNETLTDAEAALIARRYFDSNARNAASTMIDEFEFEAEDDVFKLKVVGRVKTTLLGISGQEWMPINIANEAKVAPPRALEVVLVLDNTDSMAGQKMDDLKSAATDLVTELMADVDNEVKVGIVPFATHVRIGMSRASEPWLSIPPDDSYERTECEIDEVGASNAGCFEQDTTCYDDGVPYDCTEWICPNNDPPPETCNTYTQGETWLGCVGSRTHPLNIQDTDFLSDPVPGVLNHDDSSGDCPLEILPMTVQKTDVLDHIDAMHIWGETYIPGGLSWGLRLISSAAPFSEGATYDDMDAQSGVKAIVLMTDGENTRSPNPWDGRHYSDDDMEADQYTIELCDEIKSHGIVLYTIAFEVTDSNTLAMVEDCATNPSAYFGADNASELADAFGLIGNNLVELALTK